MDSALHADSIYLSFRMLVVFLPCSVNFSYNPLKKEKEKKAEYNNCAETVNCIMKKKIQEQNNTHIGQLLGQKLQNKQENITTEHVTVQGQRASEQIWLLNPCRHLQPKDKRRKQLSRIHCQKRPIKASCKSCTLVIVGKWKACSGASYTQNK